MSDENVVPVEPVVVESVPVEEDHAPVAVDLVEQLPGDGTIDAPVDEDEPVVEPEAVEEAAVPFEETKPPVHVPESHLNPSR